MILNQLHFLVALAYLLASSHVCHCCLLTYPIPSRSVLSSVLPLVGSAGHRRCTSEYCDGARLIVFVARWGFLASGTCTTDIALASRLLASAESSLRSRSSQVVDW